jgi:cobalt-zinc-cadmium efflux system outer membrane protein
MKKLTFPLAVSCILAVAGCAAVKQSKVAERSAVGAVSTQNSARGAFGHTVDTVAYLDEDISGEDGSADSADELAMDDGLANDSEDRKVRNGDSSASKIEPFTIEPIARFESDVAFDGNRDAMKSIGYTLADIEAMALGNNPALLSAQATTSMAAGLRNQVGTRPNPTLGYFGQQMADRNTDQHGVFVEQEFVRGNKLQLNRDVLGHTQRAQAAEYETQRYRVLTDVRVRFFEAIAAQQQVDATRTFAEVARRGVQVAEDRQEAGEGTLIDTLQARTLLSEVTLAAEQAEVAYQGAWQDLAAIAGMQDSVPARLVADLSTSVDTPDWNFAYADILSRSPELTAAQAIVCEKQALLRRQQAQPISNVTAQLGAGYDAGTDHGMINALVSAPIPVWNKNSGNISAAYSDYVRATQEVQRIQLSIRSRLARAAQEFETAMKSVRKYEDEIIPQAKKSLELSEEAYRAGELGFLQVLIVRRSFYEASIRRIQSRGSLAQAASKVDGLLLTGGLDSPVDYTDGDGIRGASFGGQ